MGSIRCDLIFLRVAHVAPVHDAVQVQVFGAEQVPPLRHAEVQIATEVLEGCSD